MSVAAVQSHLHATASIDQIEVGSYLAKLCGAIAASIIEEDRSTTLKVALLFGPSSEYLSLALTCREC